MSNLPSRQVRVPKKIYYLELYYPIVIYNSFSLSFFCMLYPLFLVKKKRNRYEKDPESHRLCAIKLVNNTVHSLLSNS